ncbi:hypothetical protein L484_006987 [Morus notabilis]|uniref:Oxidative stress 3 n=1 Tax=Morus notabilis TaxID=981085 RepID=W9S6E3_9ROSA|nr:vitellogenin-1 [Morus notabilis]EXC28691.1 hypothetical protein L484_006987 [Morus notabilis]
MGKEEARKNMFSDHYKAQNESWVGIESCDDHDHDEDNINICDSRSMESSSQENSSINSIASSSSSDLVEDASSSNSSSKSCSSSSSSSSPFSSSSNNGPLYELSELMVHLPLRRGLSKFYQGKSQSFTSLASVKSLEDLPKKVAPYRKKLMKPCKSFGGGLEGNKLHYPKAIISKKSSRGSSFLSSLGSFRPSVPVQKNY